jgi:uncharacterized membrane protein
MFSFLKRKNKFFSAEENNRIMEAIREAEKQTSGEIRVFVESKCSYMDATDRAAEIFSRLQMHNTAERNAVLIYIAVKDHQLAIFGDEAIHKKVGNEYWNKLVSHMASHFHQQHFAEGIRQTVLEIGEALQKNFPHHKYTDKNELPDDIVFGR